ncbi:MAG TPA: L,D-transpeptidase family protein [Candidatus Eremiobacteraeota bacterium]|nr:MAG: putative L,D-transpeptidase YkuD [bacterium ADurb.Bin363]HPZ07317.1 L,D-transpeptidase family protein [Candidatus Eremiobacteraeota bacterium]
MNKIIFFVLFLLIINLYGIDMVSGEEISGEIMRVEVNIPTLTLTIFKNDEIIKKYMIAAGSPKTPTPLGEYYIVSKETDPTWYPPPKPVKKVDDKGQEYVEMEQEDPVPPGPDNPLGRYWLGLDRNDLGIHSTNNPSSIGYSVSHGCIRMRPENAREVFDILQVGTRVDIVYKSVDIIVEPYGSELFVASYPDIYSLGKESFPEIKLNLEQTGIPYDEGLLRKVLQESKGKFIMVSKPFQVLLNGEMVPVKALYPVDNIIEGKKEFYISQGDWNKVSSHVITWDKERKQSLINEKPVSFIVYDGRYYVSTSELARMVDMEFFVDIQRRRLIFYSVMMFLNGIHLGREGILINEKPYISLNTLSDALGIKFSWNNKTREAFVPGLSFKCVIQSNKAFLSVDKLVENFSFQMKKEGKRIVNLFYPVITLNSISLEKKAFLYHGELYISLRECSNITGLRFEWRPKDEIAVIGGKHLKGKKFGDFAYLPLSSLYKIAFVDVSHSQSGFIDISLTKIIINERFYSIEGYRDGITDEIMLKLDDCLKLARIDYDGNNNSYFLNGEKLDIKQRIDGPYVSLKSLDNLSCVDIDYNRSEYVVRIFIN